jgi:hypothetical protein
VTRRVEDEHRLVCDCQHVLADRKPAEEESRPWVTVQEASWAAMAQRSRYHYLVADHVRAVLAIVPVPEELEQHIQC